MSQKHHYTGLTDAEVLESRKKNGVNILTPPEKDPLWKRFLEKFGDSDKVPGSSLSQLVSSSRFSLPPVSHLFLS